MSIRLMAGAAVLALTSTCAFAQTAPSISGSYCGNWASGNSWQMTLQQNGSRVSASVNGRRTDGGPSSASGSGTLSGSQLTMSFRFTQGATGTFSGRVAGGAIQAAFSRTDRAAPKRRDAATFTRC